MPPPVEKDDTDTLAAVKLGLERECTDFWIYGGTGGKRLDHTLAICKRCFTCGAEAPGLFI